MADKNKRVPIRFWAEEERPREKMLMKGRHSLSNAELLGILIGSGNRDQSAVELGRTILCDCSDNLHELGKASVGKMISYPGIGKAKAISILAALELGRRRQSSTIQSRPKVTSSRDVHFLLSPFLADLSYEEFWILHLNRANKVLEKERVSSGGVSGTVVDARIIFKSALEKLSSALILVHNHPSGNLKPSQADIKLTSKLIEAGKLLDISVLDHVIISEEGYYSFADEGVMP